MNEQAKPLGGKLLTGPFIVFAILVLIGLVIVTVRFFDGLGAVTNLNDGYPWGVWIAYDVVVGTALACGGYSMALLVYAFNKGEYHPLVRPALMASMFGYTLAGVSVIFDLGRWWQAYNIFLLWNANFHSVLLEVALCIGTYVLVLWIEFAPAILEKFKARRLQKKLSRVIFVFIALGILLPTMHQSSLGTMMLAAGYKLSPLWQTGFLPLLFLVSAIIMGYGVVIFESILSSLAFKRPLETKMLARLSGFIPWLLVVFLIIRIEDVNLRGYLPLAFDGEFKSNMFLLENLLFVVAFLILVYRANRTNPRLLFISAITLILGGGLYRMNAYLIGFDPGSGWRYFPSVPELTVTFAIIGAEILAYIWFVKRLPVLPQPEKA